jgi:hypothetical protein
VRPHARHTSIDAMAGVSERWNLTIRFRTMTSYSLEYADGWMDAPTEAGFAAVLAAVDCQCLNAILARDR